MGLMRRGIKLKKLKEQTVVITGASSGIGLATARMAARAGASVLLTSRNEQDLRRVTQEIRGRGGRASFTVADVADPDAVMRVAEMAVREFGGIDSWVNNAGVSIFGKLMEVPLEDKRRLFDTNFWASSTDAAQRSSICGITAVRSSTSGASFRIARYRCRACTPPPSTR